ncbi:hypothetical protein [Enterobacter huaxiensis]
MAYHAPPGGSKGGVTSDGQSGIPILSEEECRFLDSWQLGLFPSSVDTGFIQCLKVRRKNNSGQVA